MKLPLPILCVVIGLLAIANAALSKIPLESAYLPSTWQPFVASGAIDGDINTFAHADPMNNPWIEVVISTTVPVGRIVITNRQDCCKERLAPFYIFLKADTFASSSISALKLEPGVWNQRITAPNQNQYVIDIPAVVASRFRIVLDSAEYLNIGEIELYADLQPAASVSGGLRFRDYQYGATGISTLGQSHYLFPKIGSEDLSFTAILTTGNTVGDETVFTKEHSSDVDFKCNLYINSAGKLVFTFGDYHTITTTHSKVLQPNTVYNIAAIKKDTHISIWVYGESAVASAVADRAIDGFWAFNSELGQWQVGGPSLFRGSIKRATLFRYAVNYDQAFAAWSGCLGEVSSVPSQKNHGFILFQDYNSANFWANYPVTTTYFRDVGTDDFTFTAQVHFYDYSDNQIILSKDITDEYNQLRLIFKSDGFLHLFLGATEVLVAPNQLGLNENHEITMFRQGNTWNIAKKYTFHHGATVAAVNFVSNRPWTVGSSNPNGNPTVRGKIKNTRLYPFESDFQDAWSYYTCQGPATNGVHKVYKNLLIGSSVGDFNTPSSDFFLSGRTDQMTYDGNYRAFVREWEPKSADIRWNLIRRANTKNGYEWSFAIQNVENGLCLDRTLMPQDTSPNAPSVHLAICNTGAVSQGWAIQYRDGINNVAYPNAETVNIRGGSKALSLDKTERISVGASGDWQVPFMTNWAGDLVTPSSLPQFWTIKEFYCPVGWCKHGGVCSGDNQCNCANTEDSGAWLGDRCQYHDCSCRGISPGCICDWVGGGSTAGQGRASYTSPTCSSWIKSSPDWEQAYFGKIPVVCTFTCTGFTGSCY